MENGETNHLFVGADPGDVHLADGAPQPPLLLPVPVGRGAGGGRQVACGAAQSRHVHLAVGRLEPEHLRGRKRFRVLNFFGIFPIFLEFL